jgi:hypothetical protein
MGEEPFPVTLKTLETTGTESVCPDANVTLTLELPSGTIPTIREVPAAEWTLNEMPRLATELVAPHPAP